MNELRTVDLSKKYFECGGRKFYVREVPSFNRYRELQKMGLEFGFSATVEDIYKNINAAFNFLNTMKPAEGAVVLWNIMKGIVDLSEKDPVSLRICALFIDEEGEDPTVYDEGKMSEKIECWGKELSPLPFFQLAASLVPYWTDAYQIVSQNGLKKVLESKNLHYKEGY